MIIIWGGRVLRSALEPSRSMAALFAGKFPGCCLRQKTALSTMPSKSPEPPKDAVQRWEWERNTPTSACLCSPAVVPQPAAASRHCTSFVYNFTRGFAFDSSMNFLPGQHGSESMMQGLFGVRLGQQFNHVGVFGKVRPGFIYYNKALPGGGDLNSTSLTRFAWDFGGIVEVYPHRESRSVIRFDVGTTLVRYLSDRTDDRFTQIGGVISNQYYNNQGNFQFSTGYTYRF